MLTAGLKFLADKSAFEWKYTQFEGVIGIAFAESDDTRLLDDVLNKATGEYGMTGAMHQAVINHLRYISKHSYAGWILEGERRNMVSAVDDPERAELVRQVEGSVP